MERDPQRDGDGQTSDQVTLNYIGAYSFGRDTLSSSPHPAA